MTPAEPLDPERTRQSLAILCNEQTRAMVAHNAATLGRLAAALSHEMNTPLGALRSSADTLLALAQRDTSRSSVESDLLRTIRDSTLRLSEVVARLQRFTNLNRAEVQPMCLNGLISDAAALLEPTARALVSMELEAGLPYVMGHPQQLSAVFLTLLNNGIDAGGSVRVSTRSAGRTVNVEVQDTGRGVPAEFLPEIFEPAFRERGGRMGAGNWNLFSCRHVVEAHDGGIAMESSEGQGSTVRIVLPAHNAPV